jgi:ABC-2 type transport system permease protein
VSAEFGAVNELASEPVSQLPDTGSLRDAPRTAPLHRLLGDEVRWVLRRPRTLVMLGLFALIPVLIAIGVTVADRRAGPGRGLIGAVAGNGLVLPIVAVTVSLALLLPLAVAMAAADAIAGEAACGTLRGLLLAPVSRLRLVGMKAFGVLVVAVSAVLALAVVGLLAGLLVVGEADGQLVTLSGTTLGLGQALARIALVSVWTVGQLAAVGAVALAVSAWTEHPLVVLAAVLGGLIVFGVLGAIPTLEWLQPYLLTSGWSAAVDALRDPLPLAGMRDATWRALCYFAVGIAATIARMLRRDA